MIKDSDIKVGYRIQFNNPENFEDSRQWHCATVVLIHSGVYPFGKTFSVEWDKSDESTLFPTGRYDISKYWNPVP